jgi:hypothetical protein
LDWSGQEVGAMGVASQNGCGWNLVITCHVIGGQLVSADFVIILVHGLESGVSTVLWVSLKLFHFSVMEWSNTQFIVFGAESGKVYLWEANTLVSVATVNAHGGELCVLQCVCAANQSPCVCRCCVYSGLER